MSKVVILTEAGKNIGFGHYTRCAALRDYLTQNGVEVNMVVFCNEIAIQDSKIVNYDWLNQHHAIPNAKTNDVVLVDSYLAENSFFTQIKTQFKTSIAIDDYNRITYDVDLVINPNVFFYNMDYSNQHAKCIGGKDYVLLREAFRIAPTKHTNQVCRDILVTVGGTDYRNLLYLLIELAKEFPALHWTIIDPENKLSNKLPGNATSKSTLGAIEMATLMQKADVVIAACGQTLHELVAMQTPTVGICIDHDQLLNQQYYLSLGFLQYKNTWDDTNLKNVLYQQLNELTNYTLRKSISHRCLDLINKNGVNKILSLLINCNNEL